MACAAALRVEPQAPLFNTIFPDSIEAPTLLGSVKPDFIDIVVAEFGPQSVMKMLISSAGPEAVVATSIYGALIHLLELIAVHRIIQEVSKVGPQVQLVIDNVAPPFRAMVLVLMGILPGQAGPPGVSSL